MYHCWKDAERESRRNPNNDSGGGGGCALLFIIIAIICLWQVAIQVGGDGITVAILIILGIIGGICQKK